MFYQLIISEVQIHKLAQNIYDLHIPNLPKNARRQSGIG